jgi:hypothetical protein
VGHKHHGGEELPEEISLRTDVSGAFGVTPDRFIIDLMHGDMRILT